MNNFVVGTVYTKFKIYTVVKYCIYTITFPAHSQLKLQLILLHEMSQLLITKS